MIAHPKIIIITGPCGVGKTSINQILADKLNIKLISGDRIRQELFPEAAYITEYPDKLAKVKARIFDLCVNAYQESKPALVDYVILRESYIQSFQETFRKDLIFKVLLPPIEIIYKRDKERACWTSGKETIELLYQKYMNLKELIGEENFIDNGNETVEETAERIYGLIQMSK